MTFLLLLAVPLLVAVAAFLLCGARITWKEFLIQSVVQILVAAISIAIIYSSNTSDVELWNGVVTKKERETVSCRHSYQCNCHQSCTSDSKGSQSCATICQTCHEHSYDYDWVVRISTGDTIEINRIDRQGVLQPPRWTNVRIGEPAAVAHDYTNYIKASPGSLFRSQGLSNQYKSLPEYPGKVRDYYHVDRFISVGYEQPNAAEWFHSIEEINAALGASKQANIIVVSVMSQPAEYFFALEQKWVGGKKNDIVVVVGIDELFRPQWTNVMAWTNNEMVKVSIRDEVVALPFFRKEPVLGIIERSVSQYYVRKPMEEFRYLQASVAPSTTQLIVALSIGLLISIVMTMWSYSNDIVDEGFGNRFNARPRDFFRRRK